MVDPALKGSLEKLGYSEALWYFSGKEAVVPLTGLSKLILSVNTVLYGL